MAKGGNAADARPSLTEMLILLYVPTALAVGVPVKLPVAVLNSAQTGLLKILKPSTSPSASALTGTNR